MKNLIILLAIIIFPATGQSQDNGHDHHGMHNDTTVTTDTTKDSEHNHEEMMKMNEHSEMNQYDIPMSRFGSGTAWNPDDTPMNGYMIHDGSWMFMFHGNIFLRYNSQDITKEGSRGASKFDAPNWYMVMGESKVSKNGKFGFSGMFSLDPITVGGEGYPLLFQSGETYEGKPLVDRQHPHNFFSELSVNYTHSITDKSDINIYLGYPGEPALGPVAFMHRLSASFNPDSPLGHHWQDATHITFGVATLGLRYDNVKVEGSVFTAREPSEERWGFDKPKFDSYSFRLNVNQTKETAAQISYGYIKSPEASHPDENVKKLTGSLIYTKTFGTNSFLTGSAVFGRNDAGGDHQENSFLLESAYKFSKNVVYGRFEWVQKSGEELQIVNAHDEIYNINALTLGYSRDLYKFANTILSAGLQGSIYFPDRELEAVYGKNPMSAEIYLRLSPGIMK